MIQERADILGDTVRHTTSSLNRDISDSLNQLQTELLPHGVLKDEAIHEISADGSIDYSLQDDFLSVYSVWRMDSSSDPIPLDKFNPRVHPPRQELNEGPGSFYRIYNYAGENRIQFYPRPSSGTYLCIYIPRRILDEDTDTLDDSLNWHEYIVADVCRKIFRRDTLDASDHIQDREIAFQKIVNAEEARDASIAYSLTDMKEFVEDPADFISYRRPRDY
jgi:hypothetical protein